MSCSCDDQQFILPVCVLIFKYLFLEFQICQNRPQNDDFIRLLKYTRKHPIMIIILLTLNRCLCSFECRKLICWIFVLFVLCE